MTVTVGTGGFRDKELKTRYPVEEGLIAGTTTQEGRITNLVPEERSLVPHRVKRGLDGRTR